MPTVGRRAFLANAGQGILATGLMDLELPAGAWVTADAQSAPSAPIEHAIECDVLVIGGGYAACFAAIKAREQGAAVVMVDKGLAGRSGQSPFATSTLVFDPRAGVKLEDLMDEGNRKTEYLNNRYWMETTITHSHDRLQDMVAWGLPFRTQEGGGRRASSAPRELHREVAFGGRMGDLPYALRQRALKIGVRILDRVMVAELLKQDGRVVGAIGIASASTSHEVYTFVAKTTVQAVGACGYKPAGFPPLHQLTGDGEAMAYRAGAEIFGKEFVDTHFTRSDMPTNGRATALVHMDQARVPENLKGLRNASLMGRYLLDAAENRLPDRPAELVQYPLSYLTLPLEAHAGRAPIRAVGDAGARFGIVGGSCLGMSVRHGDGLWAADEQCGSSIPGLYAAGDALGTATNGAVYYLVGSSSMGAMVTGAIAGTAAAREAAQMGEPTVPREEIARAKQFLGTPLERKGGFGPRWVTQLLQNTMAPYFVSYVKKADRLQAALTQVEFMQQHLVPMLIARDPHELRLAIETRSMVLSAEMRLRSALFRTESRGNHYREDFPRRDDGNWLAWTKIKMDQGRMTLVKVPIPRQWRPDESIPYEQRYPFRFPGE